MLSQALATIDPPLDWPWKRDWFVYANLHKESAWIG